MLATPKALTSLSIFGACDLTRPNDVETSHTTLPTKENLCKLIWPLFTAIFLLLISCVILWPRPLDLWVLCHVVNPSTNFEYPVITDSWPLQSLNCHCQSKFLVRLKQQKLLRRPRRHSMIKGQCRKRLAKKKCFNTLTEGRQRRSRSEAATGNNRRPIVPSWNGGTSRREDRPLWHAAGDVDGNRALATATDMSTSTSRVWSKPG